MKMMPGSSVRRCAAIISILLVVTDLIVMITGCGDGHAPGYSSLRIHSTYGGSVTEPGEGFFEYPTNTMVDLVAEPDEHFHFASWTGDVDTIADIESAATNITLSDDSSLTTITANFELDEGWYRLDIFSSYGGSVTEPGEGIFIYAANTIVTLVAQPDQGYQFSKWTGNVDTIADINAANTTIIMDNNYSTTANFRWYDIIQVAAGEDYTVGLKSDGTVVAVGWNEYGQCDVDNWTHITQVDAGAAHTVGLKSDGTVVAVGENVSAECDVGNWTDITQVSAGESHTVGRKSDGTVVAVGWNDLGQCDVGNWTDITQVSAGYGYTVGLKADGTVVAVGWNSAGQCNVGGWTDITQVSAGACHTVGLKSDHTVVAVGANFAGQCDVDDWMNIDQVAAHWSHTVGLETDGTVVAVGGSGPYEEQVGQCDVGDWTDIIQVAAGLLHTVGVRNDGTVTAVGDNGYGKCNVGS